MNALNTVTIRMGAAHSTLAFNGNVFDMNTDFGDTPKSSRRAARLAVVDAFTELRGSRKDKRRLRRIRKGQGA